MKFREDYSFYDLEAGCCHLGIEHEDVTFKRQELNISPLSLLETGKVDLSPLTKYNYGFGKNLKKEEIIIVLNEIIKEGLEYWEEMVSIDSFFPVVIIDNELCDGFHRCVLAYILGIEVIASYYETSYNQ